MTTSEIAHLVVDSAQSAALVGFFLGLMIAFLRGRG